MQGEIVTERDNPVLAKDGSIHYIVFSGMQTLLYEENKLAGILISGIDVTDRRNAEALTQKQQQQLIQADKMASLGILVSGVAHEINNPNNFIILNSDNLKDIWKDMKPKLDRQYEEQGDFILAGLPYSEISGEIEKLISGISEGSRRIKTIVQHLKDFARQETNDMDQQVNLNAVIESSTIILSNLIKKTTDHFIIESDRNLPSVKGNFQKIEQVVINLLTNACQALTDRNQSITLRTHQSDNRTVSLVVQDEGKGIEPAHLKHIMDPFFTTKRDSGGTGLGLAISYGIIKDHHGDFIIRSEPGKGTVAEFIMPAIQEGEASHG
jgi:signal transduction histidine kinase